MKRISVVSRFFLPAFLFVCSLCLAGCGDRAEELYDTAQFEELQNNKEHAQKLYEQIVRDHEDSPYAVKAKQRMAAMAASSAD